MRISDWSSDVCSSDGLDRLGASVNERYGRLDILVGNAGILGPLTPVGHIKPAIWQEVMDVNVTANSRLLRSLHPLRRRSARSDERRVGKECVRTCRFR